MENILRLIGKNIRKYRLQRGLSQEALADLAGLHRTYIGSVERGEKNISAINIYKLSKALEVEPCQLLKNHFK